MITEYAILDKDGKCINRTLWDGQSNWTPPEGCTAVSDPDNLYTIYQEPSEPLTAEQKLLAAGVTVDELKELLNLNQ